MKTTEVIELLRNVSVEYGDRTVPMSEAARRAVEKLGAGAQRR